MMRGAAVIFATFGLSGVALAETVAVRSGQEVGLYEALQEADGVLGPTWRYRFVAPQIARDGGSVSVDEALTDIDGLCADVVLPRHLGAKDEDWLFVISLSDRPIPFGKTLPEATQYFEAYRITDGACIWEPL